VSPAGRAAKLPNEADNEKSAVPRAFSSLKMKKFKPYLIIALVAIVAIAIVNRVPKLKATITPN